MVITKFINIFGEEMDENDRKNAINIQKAILNGECDKCKYLKECESNTNFEFPKDAYCMKE